MAILLQVIPVFIKNLHLTTREQLISLSRQNLDIPLLIRTPGYSFFIAILYKIFNVHDIVLIIANIAISLISLVLINKTLSLYNK